MVTAIEYRAMALQHHRWAGMCRSPESREEHFRLEQELLALADSFEERLHAGCATEQASNPAAVARTSAKTIPPARSELKTHARPSAFSRSATTAWMASIACC